MSESDDAAGGLSIQTASRDGWRVLAAFEKRHDRFVHELRLASRDRSLPLLRSVEGPGPVFQEAHKQQDETGAVLFLTGMSNRLYWSASVASVCKEPPSNLEFDFACNSTGAECAASSEYDIASGVEAVLHSDGSLQLSTSGSPVCVLAPRRVPSGESCALARGDDRVVVRAADADTSRRWAFQVYLAS